MKKLHTLAVMCLIARLSMAQQVPSTVAVREAGLGFSGLNSFSLQYRWGSEKKLYRIAANLGASASNPNNTTTASGGNVSTSSVLTPSGTPVNLNLGTTFSILHLKPVNPKVGFVVGFVTGINYTYNNSKMSGSQSTTSGGVTTTTANIKQVTLGRNLIYTAGVALGFYYKLTDTFFTYAEVDPGLFIGFSKSENLQNVVGTQTADNKITNTTYGLSGVSNSGATISLVYRFSK